MSTVGDVLSGLRQVLLLQSHVDQLDKRISGLASDVDGLTDAVSNVRDRVSRIEGMIEGFGMAAGAAGRTTTKRIEG